MMQREMTPMHIPDSDFQAPKIDGLLSYFLVLHRMMRKTLVSRIGYSEVVRTYEWNLLDERFDVFEYIVDEIWNIATNPLRSCGFTPYIQYMIEVVAHKKFYKDVKLDPLRPAVPKDLRTHRASSSTPVAAPSCTTRRGGASSASSSNTDIQKMFRGIFATCHRSVHGCDGAVPSDCA
jgi:hypothetical protein